MAKGKANSFARHAAPYLKAALKKAGRTFRPGPKPRASVIKALQKRRDEANAKIRQERKRGR